MTLEQEAEVLWESGLFLPSKQQLPLRKSIFHTQIPIRGSQLEWMAHHFA